MKRKSFSTAVCYQTHSGKKIGVSMHDFRGFKDTSVGTMAGAHEYIFDGTA